MAQPVAILFYSFIAFFLIVLITLYLRKLKSPGKKDVSRENEESIHDTSVDEKNRPNDQSFETNIKGIFVAGELGGMNTLNSAAKQAGSAVGYIANTIAKNHKSDFDLVIIGAGPAGISASLAARQNNLRFIVLEQDTIETSIINNPKKKLLISDGDIVLPLAGRVKIKDSGKSDLMNLFRRIVNQYRIPIQENCRVESIIKLNKSFNVISTDLQNFTTAAVLLTIGKRGSPAKLNVPGEAKEKVAYTISDIDSIKRERVLIVGGNNASVESALILSGQNEVTISCRQNVFSELTPFTGKLVEKAISAGSIRVFYSSKVVLIEENHIILSTPEGYIKLYNDLVFILHRDDSTGDFLERAGIRTAGIFAEEYHFQ